MELDNPDIVLIQETMGKGDQLIFELKKSLGGMGLSCFRFRRVFRGFDYRLESKCIPY
jgi:hypothetical protein